MRWLQISPWLTRRPCRLTPPSLGAGPSLLLPPSPLLYQAAKAVQQSLSRGPWCLSGPIHVFVFDRAPGDHSDGRISPLIYFPGQCNVRWGFLCFYSGIRALVGDLKRRFHRSLPWAPRLLRQAGSAGVFSLVSCRPWAFLISFFCFSYCCSFSAVKWGIYHWGHPCSEPFTYPIKVLRGKKCV